MLGHSTHTAWQCALLPTAWQLASANSRRRSGEKLTRPAECKHDHTCFASSRVGARTITLGLRPEFFRLSSAASRSTMGNTKAKVLPQPVLTGIQAVSVPDAEAAANAKACNLPADGCSIGARDRQIGRMKTEAVKGL